MGQYTIELRHICEAEAGLTEVAGYSGVNAVIQAAIPKLFDFDFPIYDDSYRNVLCTKILKHYYMREIGAETVGQWKLWLDTRLNEIMPYYNQLYKSAMIEFNPLYDVDLTTKHTRENGGTTDVTGSGSESSTRETERHHTENGVKDSTASMAESGTVEGNGERTESGSSTSTTNHKQVSDKMTRDAYSDTPQGTLENVDNLTYLTNFRKVTGADTVTNDQTAENSGTTTSKNSNKDTSIKDVQQTGKETDERKADQSGSENSARNSTNAEKTVATSTEEYVQTIKGKNGGASYAKLLQEFRKTFLNIDTQIIDELSDLFFGLW